MIIENSKMKNRNLKEDIEFRRALLDKHSQLMRMYLRYNNPEQARNQFEIIKPLFTFLNNEGEKMDYYTLEDFEGDSKRFEKMRHRKEESYMKKPKYQNYRVCYENGNPATGTKIYELYKNCDCPDCKYRTAGKREPVNRATATTKDISKVDEVAEFLKKWTCGDGRRYLEIAYYKF